MSLSRRMSILLNEVVPTKPFKSVTLGAVVGLVALGSLTPAAAGAATPAGRPVVASTYFGGPGYDIAWQSAVDGSGNVYIAGDTQAAGFPVTARALQRQFGGGGQDGFLAKFDRNGRLLWSTYLGGSGWDGIFGVSVDPAGDALVTGVTDSTNFPVTSNAVQHTLAGGSDAFVTVISPDGTKLVYSTYLGGATADGAALPVRLGNLLPPADDEDLGLAVRSGPGGDLYIAGETDSIDMPATTGAAQPLIRGNYDCFLARISTSAAKLVYLTYLGGSGYDYCEAMAVDSAGNAYVTGQAQSLDFPVTPGAYQLTHTLGTAAFITKINPTGTTLLYSTLLSGSQGSSGASGTNYTAAGAIAVDAAGNAYVAGDTNDTDLPTTAGVFQRSNGGEDDGFVTELAPSGSSLVFSTYLGGSDYDGLFGLALDPAGNILVDGFTASRNIPLVGAFQSKFGGYIDAWVAKLSPGGSSLRFSSYLGGTNQDLAYGLSLWNSQIYLTGMTASTNFPVVQPAIRPRYGGGIGDAFLTIVRPPS